MQRELARVPVYRADAFGGQFSFDFRNPFLGAATGSAGLDHRILLRDCQSFVGLGETWLRIGLQSARNNHRILRALNQLPHLTC